MENDLSHIRMCPECRGEYQAHMEMCIECNVALGPWTPPPPPRDALPPVEELVKASTGDSTELAHRAQHLANEGIASCIDTDPPGRSLAGGGGILGGGGGYELALYVAPHMEAEVARVLEEFNTSRIPVAAEGEIEIGEELDACPACGTAAVANAEECHDCGLLFG